MASYRDLAGALEAVLRAVEASNIRTTSTLFHQATKLLDEARAGDVRETKWTRFVEPAGGLVPPGMVKAAAAAFAMSEAAARAAIAAETKDVSIWVNSRYQVLRRQDPGSEMIYLSIKRLDQRPIRNWRDLQRIKTELVGAECEGLELFPAESRLVDTSNQYHLWVVAKPGAAIPVGFTGARTVMSGIGGGEGQEPLEDDL